jgi:hypothetical protein
MKSLFLVINIIVLTTICFLIISCKNESKKNESFSDFSGEIGSEKNIPENGNSNSIDLIKNSKFPTKFIDSISKRYELTIDQLKKNTTINKDYFNSTNCKFIGDSIFGFSNASKYFFATIIYDDGSVCRNKFLLVFSFNNGSCSDNMLVETDCDEDESSEEYRKITYGLQNDSSFFTIESINNHKQNSLKDIKKTWKINSLGKIEIIQ